VCGSCSCWCFSQDALHGCCGRCGLIMWLQGYFCNWHSSMLVVAICISVLDEHNICCSSVYISRAVCSVVWTQGVVCRFKLRLSACMYRWCVGWCRLQQFLLVRAPNCAAVSAMLDNATLCNQVHSQVVAAAFSAHTCCACVASLRCGALPA
jgi:hypothetical protein